MRKKIVGLLMAMLLCVNSTVFIADRATAATKTSADFSDLKDLDAATKAKFDAMISAGVFDGVEEGKFGLKDEMNRAQFAKVAALIFNLKVDTSLHTSSFQDVKADDPANGYALPYIEAIKAAGITDGYGPGIYAPADRVTKEQLAAFLLKGLGLNKDAQATPGVDDATVSDWAKGYVALALDLNLLPAEADGTFGGQAKATRELLVSTAYNAKEQYNIQEDQKKKEEEEEKKKAEEEKKQEEEKKKQEEPVWSPAPPPIQTVVQTPTALPASGVVTSGTLVTLSSTTPSATVYYTTDLSEPTASSTPYTEPIVMTSNTTIKAIAVKPGATNSSVASFEYTVTFPILLPDSLSPMTEGQPYAGSAAKLSGGTGAVSYQVTDGVLPAGLTLNPNTGEITGTPIVSGEHHFTIRATDSATPPTTATRPYTVTIAPAPAKTPLDLINEASASGNWDQIDEMTFTDAEITGVTSSNVSTVIDALVSAGTSVWTVSDIQAIVDSVVGEIAKQAALDLINYESENGILRNVNETNVTVATFAVAGITGVTADNLYAIEYALEISEAPYPRLSNDIQAIVDETIRQMTADAMVEAILNYLGDLFDTVPSPTVEDFELAEITRVNASNIIDILDELRLVYWESRNNMFGTPMSSREHIQEAIDIFLGPEET